MSTKDQSSALELPPDLLAFARHQVEQGSYSSIMDVVRDAFSLLQGQSDKVARLRTALDEGIAELDAGKGQLVQPGELTADIRTELGLPRST